MQQRNLSAWAKISRLNSIARPHDVIEAHPVFQFGDPLPVIDTVLLNPLEVSPLGAGECTITTVAAAVGNGIFDATGVRIRQAPFTPARVLAALMGLPVMPR